MPTPDSTRRTWRTAEGAGNGITLQGRQHLHGALIAPRHVHLQFRTDHAFNGLSAWLCWCSSASVWVPLIQQGASTGWTPVSSAYIVAPTA